MTLRTASRRTYTAWVAAALAVVGVSSAVAGVPADAKSEKAPKAETVRLSSGVVFNRSNFTLHEGKKSYKEEAVTLSLYLSPHTSLDAAYSQNKVSGARSTLPGLAYQEHAIAGVSGNVFIDHDPHAAGDGGISHLGTIVKSELKGKDDSLWVSGTGHAYVGDPGFDGYLTTSKRHRIHVSSVNYVDNASKGAVTILDYHQAPVSLPKCFVATFSPIARNTYRVQSVTTNTTRFNGVSGSTRALVTCGSHQTAFITEAVTRGETLTGSWGYAGSVATLVSGTNHIVKNGKPYHDPHGIPASTDKFQNQRVPEDFACVQGDSRHVLLGSVVGWHSYSAGMTYAELSSYLVKRGCREAIALNNLYDSTLVAKLPGHSLAVETPHTTHGVQKLVSGLLVTTR